ncbi:MAG: ATP-binding protein [Pseudomonadota bacterium]
MFRVLACIANDHDLRFVLVAALVCATAAGAAFGAYTRLHRAQGSSRWLWAGLTALVAGSGTWSTHFIAMLAYEPTLPIGYAPLETFGSWAIAVVGMGAGFALPTLVRTERVALLGGALTGLAVATMHFVGIAGVRAAAHIEWDYAYVAAAIAIAVCGGACAFWIRHGRTGWSAWRIPAGVLVLTIVGLHFTAMTAVTLVPDPTIAVPPELVSRTVMLYATLGLTLMVIAIAGGLNWMERASQRSTLLSLRHALNAVPGGLAFYDGAGHLSAWNRPFAALMNDAGVDIRRGLTSQELIGAVMKAGWFDEVIDELPDDLRPWDATHGLKFHIPDGRWLKHEVHRTSDGGAVTVLTDITAEKERVFALAAARDEAEAASRAKSAFLANISHEIRTPLNGVLGVAEMMRRTELTERQLELLDVIQNSAGHLDTLLSDVLDLAKVEAGVVELHPEPTDVGALALGVQALFSGQAEDKGVGLRLELSGAAGGWAMCDPVRLRQVLTNLVSNAVKFTEAGEVVVALRRSGDDVTFVVGDTGPGFDAARKAALFGRFAQGDDSATRRHGGAGLGLAICQDYVRLMGGELDAESTLGVGSVFQFTLPMPTVAAPLAEPIEAPGPEADLRVLIVDDNPVNRQVLSMILDAVGVEHAEVEDGQQGVDAATTGAYDIVLMDIQMPVMDGLEATRLIRRWEADTGRRRMPIIIVSANCLQEHVDAGVAAGADGHLAKPVSVPQLVGALEQHAAQRMAA